LQAIINKRTRLRLRAAQPVVEVLQQAMELSAEMPLPRPDQEPWANEVGKTRRRMIDEELDKR
jgi:hypothetical protein